MAAYLLPDPVQPAVEVVMRDAGGKDTRMLLDASCPVAVLDPTGSAQLLEATSLSSFFRTRIAPSADGCWRWTGSIDHYGYGKFHRRHVHYKAHRAVYEALRGPIPAGLVIDHLCRVRSCVNPAHMEPVTSAVNTLRGAGWAAENASKTTCKNGHEFTADNTYVMPNGNRSCRECRRASGRRWKRRRNAAKQAGAPA